MNNFCFIHVPKCGGMTFREIVAGRCAREDILPASNLDVMQLAPEAIAKAKAAAGHFDYGIFAVLPPGFLKFTILRDPVKRYVSTVSHMMRDPAFSEFHAQLAGMTLDQAAMHPPVRRVMRNAVVKLFCKDPLPIGVASREEAIRLEAERQNLRPDLSLAMERLEGFDVVGTQEHYIESVQLMLAAADLPPLKRAIVVNDDTTGAQADVSPQVLDNIRDLLDRDQVLFDYACRRIRRDVADALYALSAHRYAHAEPPVADRCRLDLAALPGAYGWYAPERDEHGIARRWSGSLDEQGFVIKIRPRSKYLVVLGFQERVGGGKLSIRTNLRTAQARIIPSGAVLFVDNPTSNDMLDVTITYPQAASPKAQGTGEDLRKLGIVMFHVGVFRVESLDGLDIGPYVEAAASNPPGLLP